ncbi:Lrp/AsnC family transcriptional regulator [Yinghuangia seranimata]|uniref:Lrp/AsnC family transcriptional regulator n=1 Tax=Yinghuangia seranimata TaxID=408067 RepID=UPI00248BE03D|nr:Lrp/AsnC family transcriptional regulator [Yinghuangia seranimata]MDI2124985.1 Lrp/AsnC family transcriptional regulator [Yinghuangia seranimata]
MLSEADLALVHALQVRPRASWTDLARVLDVDPVTVARRYGRLADRGEVWVGASPGPRLFDQLCVAYVEIDCTAGSAAGVAAVLGRHPQAVTIERPADTHRLLVTVATGDVAAMSRYTLDVLSAVPDVAAVRSSIVSHMFTEGGRWRIDALDAGQRSRLAAPSGSGGDDQAAGSHEITDRDRALLGLLSVDGRASYQALADGLGTTAPTVRRRVDQLVRLGLFRFRCDFARPLGGWPVAVTFRASAPVKHLSAIGHALVRLPQVRNCAAVTGDHNLLVQASLHTVGDILAFEGRLGDVHPDVVVANRTVSMRHDKLLGRLLDREGRSVGVVPPDVWREPAA